MKIISPNISPNDIEKNSICSKKFKTLFNFKGVEQSKKVSDRLDRYDQRKYTTQKKLEDNLDVGEKNLCFSQKNQEKISTWEIL